ncbi:MAG: hypothetical protein KAI24_24990, partial [Planctomycetes bacterium]|nr:hypothetical protein [Planctomycetota bacterium]
MNKLHTPFRSPLTLLTTIAFAAAPTTAQFGGQVTGGQLFTPITLGVGGVVTVQGTSGDDVVTVRYPSLFTIEIERGTWSKTYNRSAVTKVRCEAGDGNDTLRNYTSVPCEFDGGNGNDYLLGGSGADRLVGGYGQDTIYGGSGDDLILGSGGSDYLSGQNGDDVIHGHGGNDTIYGGYGRDSIFPGSGNDTVYGGSGQDLIVTIGGGNDAIWGGHQWDNFWVDYGDAIYDASSNEQQLGYVHTVASFEVLNASTHTFQPSLEPDGLNIPDPQPLAGHSVLLMDKSAQPLFGPGGPSEDDVLQGAVGDCYFMAVLSAIAHQQPEEIRKMVTSLGDGSYAVRFFRNGQPCYVRVDGDLWTTLGGAVQYAKPGPSGAIWVPIVEKAFAFFREGAGTFASINGGHTHAEHHTAQLGATTHAWQLPQSPSKEAIIAWDQAGRTNAYVTYVLENQSRQLMEWIDGHLQAGAPVYTGAKSSVSNGTPIAEDTYRRGQHLYEVYAIERDAQGNPDALVLRDPYGSFRTLTDHARIVYLVG